MKKPYERHEIVYKKMKEKGVRSWNENQRIKAVDAETKRFLTDVLAQPWRPKGGRVIELGCGTGPILRWICKRGFSGLGIDVSKTAIAMAKEQSKGLNVRFKQADVCRSSVERVGKFDLAIDGHCLHCIIRHKDRKAFLENSFKLLRKGGLFVVMTMCSPADKRIFSKVCEGQKLIDYMAARKVPHWKSILSEIQKAGFKIKLLQYKEAFGQEPLGDLSVAALA
jgi:SAM-dependent methyltransferase